MKKKHIIILIIMLTIGFASVTASIFLTGKTNIRTNENDYDVYFTEATLNNEESEKVTILEDGKKITFTTDKLSDVGHTSVLDYKIKNNSTQYGANILMNCTGMENEYISINATIDGNTIPLASPVHINAQEVKSGKITATMIKLPTESEMSLELVCTLNVVPTEEENIVERIPEVLYTEEILKGTDPVLADNLIPVTIENDGTVKKADLYSEWYDYETKRWANAVILENESVTYNKGEVIPENNIESYFVWIPRYKYKIWNTGNYPELTSVTNAVQTIDVVFETKDVEASNGNTVGSYLTHPAFTSFDVNGLWVGKFETGYKGAPSTTGAESNTYDVNKIEIKPNVYSWRYINIANAHKNSYNYQRNLDSHLMKNTEWGAVAYLQHSMYGSRKSVRINNNSSYITGYAAKNEPTTGYTATNVAENIAEGTEVGVDGSNTYNYLSNQKDSEGNTIADLASTTGNKSGIYDMSGGTLEYVMGVMMYSDNKTLCAGRNSTYTSGFAGKYCEYRNNGTTTGEPFPAEKYYDKYAYSTSSTQFQRGMLGDATKEMGPFANAKYGSRTNPIGSWYVDDAWFVNCTHPWFQRGANYDFGTESGVFSFGIAGRDGSAVANASFRVVLAPQN